MVQLLGGLLPQAEPRLEVVLHLYMIRPVQLVREVKHFMHLAVRQVQQLVCPALRSPYREHVQFHQ